MSSLPSNPLLDPVLVAIIAGAVGFLASVLSKEQKTSEFRQAWIDALRNDLAELVSVSALLDDTLAVAIRQGKTVPELRAVFGDKDKEFERLGAAAARIRLRLNPEEHRVLKAEWRRVKRGEATFFVTKWVSLLLLVSAGVLALMVFSGKVALIYVP